MDQYQRDAVGVPLVAHMGMRTADIDELRANVGIARDQHFRRQTGRIGPLGHTHHHHADDEQQIKRPAPAWCSAFTPTVGHGRLLAPVRPRSLKEKSRKLTTRLAEAHLPSSVLASIVAVGTIVPTRSTFFLRPPRWG